jgi:predicted acetyltransferase
MMDIRRLGEDDLSAYQAVVSGAYPVLAAHTAEEREQTLARYRAELDEPGVAVYGAFRDGLLVGSMKLWDFTMNVFGAQVPTGGVGQIAVDLLHKKEHIAKELVTFFLEHYRAEGVPFAALYPFRPDFYHQMGFGYGTKVNEYRVHPVDLPAGDKAEVVPLTSADVSALSACYARIQARTHGLMHRPESHFARRLTKLDQHAIGHRKVGVLTGYLLIQFQSANIPGNFTANDLVVLEMLAETPEALRGLLAFLRSQSDQVRHIVFRTQDPHFSDLFFDARIAGSAEVIPYVVLAHIANTQGLGIMYRMLDIAAAFRALRDHDFGGQTLRLRLAVRDSFLPANQGAVRVDFQAGRAEVVAGEECDVEVALDVSELASLLLGVVPFTSLYRHGLATLSDPAYLDSVTRLFLAAEPPICLTGF